MGMRGRDQHAIGGDAGGLARLLLDLVQQLPRHHQVVHDDQGDPRLPVIQDQRSRHQTVVGTVGHTLQETAAVDHGKSGGGDVHLGCAGAEGFGFGGGCGRGKRQTRGQDQQQTESLHGLVLRESFGDEGWFRVRLPNSRRVGLGQAVLAKCHLTALARALAVALRMASEVIVAPLTASTPLTSCFWMICRGVSVRAE